MRDQYEEIVIEPANRFGISILELWQYRELFYFFTWRDIKVKYKQTFLGVLWVMLQPLLMMLVFTFFFRQVVEQGELEIPYPIFVFSGVLLWTFFSSAVTNSGNSMVLNAPIIKKIYFPRLIIPISAILAALVDLFVALILFVFFLLFSPSVSVNFLLLLVFWPLAFLLGIISALGLGCGLSALMVKYRDFRFVIPFALQLAFFLTPIVYPVSKSDIPILKYILALNPMYGAIMMFRIPMMTSVVDPYLILISVFSALCFLVVGFGYFKKTELYFADLA